MTVRLALGCQPPWPAGPSPTAYIRLQPTDLSLPTALLSGCSDYSGRHARADRHGETAGR
ncbi:hypothetical protein BDA96_04G011400 [Sorghum bicolor]|uniref:Uncharacterized protein n=2 Tax=Sorghum bicolor TaxID=4558 RepID=A0A921UHK0_SORBI|nr:hypothetical protein BDA96_04G011400 [Sorghum bicolor]OQU84202.1 hypothetical protein SORBI_3004G010151 [Sorghum bicolor]